MGKSLLETIENKVYWGILGAFLTIAFGFVGLYSYLNEPKPSILFEITNESNVLDLHKPLDNLTIYFEEEDIQKNNLNLRIITIQISNNGEVDILQSYYDQNIQWGFKINNGKIINNARIVNTNSDYLLKNISPTIKGDNVVELNKVILEKGKTFSTEVLVLHSKDNFPEVIPLGKIVGIDKISPIKTWKEEQTLSFIDTFFYGGLLVNIVRPVICFILIIVLLIVIALSADSLGDFKRNRKSKRRKKMINKLFNGDPENEQIKLLTETYVTHGLDGLKNIEKDLNKKKEILFTINSDKLMEEHDEKVNALKQKYGIKEPDEDDEFLITKETKRKIRYLNSWHSYHTKELIKKGVISINDQDEVVIDKEFNKNLSKLLKLFDDENTTEN